MAAAAGHVAGPNSYKLEGQVMGYYYAPGNGIYISDDIYGGYGYGYYGHDYTYENANTGYYHHNAFTESVDGGTVYRHDVDIQQSAYYGETRYQNQYVEGSQDSYGPPQANGSSDYDIYTQGAETQTYVNLQNYAAGWTETTQTYGYGGAYGEYISGYSTYNGPIEGSEGHSYSTYVYAYNGYTPLR